VNKQLESKGDRQQWYCVIQGICKVLVLGCGLIAAGSLIASGVGR